jgi:nicotinamidase-related amidase
MSAITQSALVLIDLQNDFLSEGGAFSKRHCEPAQLLDSIQWALSAARQQGRRVVWVRSCYGENPAPPEQQHGHTHTGSPCCQRDSWGAQWVAPLAALPEVPGELRIVKQWYSAFRETGLHEWLQAEKVQRLILCGVATNVCIQHSAQEARRLGYEVDILEDATTAGTQSKHLRALRDLEQLACRVRRLGDFLNEGDSPVELRDIAGNSVLYCRSLDACISQDNTTFERLAAEVEWHRMSHRGGDVPRLVALQATRDEHGAEPLYRHPADEQPPLCAWTPTVELIRREVEKWVGHPVNHCLLQLYRNGRDWISEHSDKTLDLVRPSSIINVSLGQLRTMGFRSKIEEKGVSRVIKLPLPHASLLRMSLETNQHWYHTIRQQHPEREDGPRISLTFRQIGSYYEPSTGAVWGVGAKAQSIEEARERAKARQALSADERAQQEHDEAKVMLQLFREENINPAFDASVYRPGFEVLNFSPLHAKTETRPRDGEPSTPTDS